MELMQSDPQPVTAALSRWQIKWGTPIPLCVQDTVEVRGFGQLDVEVFDQQCFMDCLAASGMETTAEVAHTYLKDIVVQKLQETAAGLDLAAFPEDDGPLPPECMERMMADTSASLRAQLAGTGLELGAFVIMAGSYRYVRPRRPELWAGGEGRGCQTVPLERDFRTPVVSPEALSPLPVSETMKALMGLLSQPVVQIQISDDISLDLPSTD